MPGTDGHILSKHEDIELVVKNWERFPPIMSVRMEELTKQQADLEELDYNNCLPDRIDCMEYASHNKFLHQPGIMLGTLELHLNFTKAG